MMNNEKIPVCAAARLPHPKNTLFQLPRPRRCLASRTGQMDGYYRRRAATAAKEAALARREAAEAKNEAALARREVAKVHDLVHQLAAEQVRRRDGAAATIAAAIRGHRARQQICARPGRDGAAAILGAAIHGWMARQTIRDFRQGWLKKQGNPDYLEGPCLQEFRDRYWDNVEEDIMCGWNGWKSRTRACQQVAARSLRTRQGFCTRSRQYSAAPRLAALFQGRKVREQLWLQQNRGMEDSLWLEFQYRWYNAQYTEEEEHDWEVFYDEFDWAKRHCHHCRQVYGGTQEGQKISYFNRYQR